MSDPVSNADIEDVLSSIRRLVSEEPQSSAPKAVDEPDLQVERFVLTPAFRVEDEPESGGAIDEHASDNDQTLAMENPVDENVFHLNSGDDAQDAADDEVSDADDAVEQDNTALEADELNAQISEEYQSSEEWSDEDMEADSIPEGVEVEQGDVIDASGSNDIGSLEDMSLEDRIAELESAIEKAPQDWEPDGSEDDASDETTPISLDLNNTENDETLKNVLSLSPNADADDTPDVAMAEDGPESEAPQTESEESASAMADAAVAEIIETLAIENATEPEIAEPAEAELTSQPDADLQELDEAENQAESVKEQPEEKTDASEALRSWNEPMMRDVTPDDTDDANPDIAAAEVSQEEEHEEKAENILADEEATLDEEGLRALVSDIVREELQGVLGERITRNVRRLVRREIQRSLTMRDLD